jgi:predicted ribosome quality control (RQC) complex YloA/Tae2 family protein
MGWGETQSVENIQELINQYYTQQLNQQGFYHLRHQLTQKLQNILGKLNTKAKAFKDRLEQSEDADKSKPLKINYNSQRMRISTNSKLIC